jgi:hypothetical protein
MSKVQPIRVLVALAESRALLFSRGCYGTALDAAADLWVYAEENGLTRKHGDAAIIAIIERPFAQLAQLKKAEAISEDDGKP